MDDYLTREERIRKYAYQWYEIMRDRGFPTDPNRDWEKAEHAVDAEDMAKMMEHRYRPSKLREDYESRSEG